MGYWGEVGDVRGGGDGEGVRGVEEAEVCGGAGGEGYC